MIDFVSSLKSAQEKLWLKNGAMQPEMNPHGVISSISMLVVADVESSEDRGSGAALAFLLGFSAPPLRPFWCKKSLNWVTAVLHTVASWLISL